MHGGGGAARGWEGRHAEGTREAEEAGTRERDGEAWGVEPPAARARSARSAQLGDDEGDH